MGTTGFVLSLFAIILCILSFFVPFTCLFTVLFAITSIVFSIIGIVQNKKTAGKIGLPVSGLIISIISMIVIIIFFVYTISGTILEAADRTIKSNTNTDTNIYSDIDTNTYEEGYLTGEHSIDSMADNVSNNRWINSDALYFELYNNNTFSWFEGDLILHGNYEVMNGYSALAEASNYTDINYTQLYSNEDIDINCYYFIKFMGSSVTTNGIEKLFEKNLIYFGYYYEENEKLELTNLQTKGTGYFVRDTSV